MFNTKFVLPDGEEIFPGYLDVRKRQELKEKIGDNRCFMWCGCRTGQGERLYYRVSEDLRIYPEHTNYVHDQYCSRYKNPEGETIRQTAYVVDEENGNVTAHISFNPKVFSMKEDVEKEQKNDVPQEDIENGQEEFIIEKQKNKAEKKGAKKEQKLSLPGLIRSINTDTFMEKIISGKRRIDRESFSRYVYHRMKKIHIPRTKKSIGDLSLEKDGVRFFYLPYAGSVRETERGLIKCYVRTFGKDGETYNNFIFEPTLSQAANQFRKQYGTEPDGNTMVAGFQYLKKSRSGHSYRVFGRIHLFQISDAGLYCKNMAELSAFNCLHEVCGRNKDVNFQVIPEDETISGVVSLKGHDKKILLLSRSGRDERITYNTDEYIPLIVDDIDYISEDFLYSYFDVMPGHFSE